MKITIVILTLGLMIGYICLQTKHLNSYKLEYTKLAGRFLKLERCIDLVPHIDGLREYLDECRYEVGE